MRRVRHAAKPLTIIIDTREPERTALRFGDIAIRRTKLDTGDYSIEGYEKEVAVERKEKSDAYSCVGGDRERFERCLDRLSRLKRAAIVIECNLRSFTVPPSRSAISPQQAVGSYISWSCRYRLPIFWCENRDYAARVTLRFLMAYLKHRSELI